MNYNRRKFIYLSVMGGAGLLFPKFLMGKTNNIPVLNNASSIGTLQVALEYARQANILRLNKSYAEAELKYREAIKLMPNDIRFIDGLRKVLVVQNRVDEIVSLYETGYKNNLQNPKYAFRLGDIYKQIEFGNKKLASKVKTKNGFSSLTEESKKLYNIAATLNAEYINSNSLLKVNNLKENKAKEIDSRGNSMMKSLKKKNEDAYFGKLKNAPKDKLKTFVSRISSKKRRSLSVKEEKIRKENVFKNKKNLELLLIKQFKQESDWDSAIATAENLYNTSKDSHAFYILKKLYKKNNHWDKLIDIQRNKYTQKKDFWIGLGLMKLVKEQISKTENSSHLNEVITLSNEMLNALSFDVQKTIKIHLLMAQCYIASKQYSSAETSLEKIKVVLISNGIIHSPTINEFIYTYAMLFLNKGSFINAERILKIGLGKLENVNDDFAILFKQKIAEKNTHKHLLEVALAKVYLKTDPSKANAQLQHILSVYPNDKFATQHL